VEECDDGNTLSDDGCSNFCVLEICGDGVVNNGEVCDTGGDTGSCDNDCTFPACGDGTLNEAAAEQCDDGNTLSGDGCATTCQFEIPSLPPATFLGYADWVQSCGSQTDAVQDATMDDACDVAFTGSRAATTIEILTQYIGGLPGGNNSGGLVIFKCPFCEGNLGVCADGHARKCHGGGSWPTSLSSGWNTNCESSERKAMCVMD
jgi:cysteine-rich repeat protein